MVCSPLRAISCIGLSRLCVRAPRYQWHHQVLRVPLPDIGVTFIRETCIASCEDITPRSCALTASCVDPARLSPPSAYASCEESLPVATSPCCRPDHPDERDRARARQP